MTTKRPKKTARKPRPVADYVLPLGKALVLRTCKADLSSNAEEANGFKWPKAGPVKCDDWQPTKECGHGLHGLLWGEGAGNLLNWDTDAAWLVVEIDPTTSIDLDGKVEISTTSAKEFFGLQPGTHIQDFPLAREWPCEELHEIF